MNSTWPMMAFFFFIGVVVGNLFIPQPNQKIEFDGQADRMVQTISSKAKDKASAERTDKIDYWGGFDDEDVFTHLLASKKDSEKPSNISDTSTQNLAQKVEAFYKNVESVFPESVDAKQEEETTDKAFEELIGIVGDSEYWKAEKTINIQGTEYNLSLFIQFYSIKSSGNILDNIEVPTDLYWWQVASVKSKNSNYSFSGFGNAASIKNFDEKLWMTTNLVADRGINSLFSYFSFTLPNIKSETEIKYLGSNGHWVSEHGVLWYPVSNEEFMDFQKNIVASND